MKHGAKRTEEGKITFGNYLKRHLKTKGTSQDEAAEAIKMLAPTFRSRLMKNDFRDNEIEALQEALKEDFRGNDTIDFGKKAGNTSSLLTAPKTVADVLRKVDQQRKALDAHLDRFASELDGLVQVMAEGDVMVIATSTVTPLEFDKTARPALLEAFVTAIANGGMFVYIRPDAEYIEDNLTRLKYDTLIEAPQAQKEATWFKRKMAEMLAKRQGAHAADAEKTVTSHVLSFESHRSPFFAAGFCLTMIHTKGTKDEAIRRMMIRVPGSGRALLQAPGYERFSRRFNTWVINVIQNQIKLDGIDADLKRQLGVIIETLSEGGAAD